MYTDYILLDNGVPGFTIPFTNKLWELAFAFSNRFKVCFR